MKLKNYYETVVLLHEKHDRFVQHLTGRTSFPGGSLRFIKIYDLKRDIRSARVTA